MYVNFLSIRILTKSPACVPQQLYKPASRGLSAIAELFVSPYGSPIILVLLASNIFTKFWRGHHLRGAKYRWGRKNARFSSNKSLYLANDTKYRHSYYGR